MIFEQKVLHRSCQVDVMKPKCTFSIVLFKKCVFKVVPKGLDKKVLPGVSNVSTKLLFTYRRTKVKISLMERH